MTPKSVISYSVPGPSGTPMFPSHRRPLPAGAGKVREMRTRSRGPVVGVVNLPALTAGLANKLTNSHRSVHTYTHAECASMCTEENGRKRSAAGCRCWYNPNNSRVALRFCFLQCLFFCIQNKKLTKIAFRILPIKSLRIGRGIWIPRGL
jgi:hypothetical protein